MGYTPYYSDWKDKPDKTTPALAAAFNHIEAGIVAASANPSGTPTVSLAQSSAVGDTTLNVAGTIPDWWGTTATVLISAYTTRAELKSATISGSTLTVSALKQAHTHGDTVMIVDGAAGLNPLAFGCVTGTADNWAPFQRAVIETTALGVIFQFASALAGTTFQVSKPICVPTSSQWRNIGIKTHSTFAPAEVAGALVMVANRSWAFSAATNDVFTVPTGHGMSSFSATNHTKIVFATPYGETLPTPLVAGQVYYVDTVPSPTTFTVSASSGGAKLDITAAGTGWGFESIEQLSRVSWDNVRFDVTIANANGLLANLQQPSYIQNMRIEMDANAASRAYGAVVGGQIGYLGNIEINPSANVTALYLYGTGMVVDNFNCNGVFSGDIGIDSAGNACTLSNLWTESVSIGVRIPVENRGLTINGSWLLSGGNASSIALQVDNIDAAYEVGIIKGGTNGYTVLNDTVRSIVLKGTTGTPTSNDVTDFQGTYLGHIQRAQNDADLGNAPPKFRFRNSTGAANGYLIRYIDEAVYVSSAGASPTTVTLPSAVGWDGYQVMVFHYAGANVCTIATTGGQTIDGAATYDVPLGGNVVLVSAVGNWQIVTERA